MLIFAIETSCDETAASIADFRKNKIQIIANTVSSQIDIHKKYGGVIPEIAAREHVLNILPVIDETLAMAGLDRKKAAKKIDYIATTFGPGLITSLMVGAETARALAYSWDKPLIPVNHMAGHIAANFIGQDLSKIKLPAIILIVSGGHTDLVLMKKLGQYKALGGTRDDAAGEAFDKAAKILGLEYPGGPNISKKAAEFAAKNKISNIKLPRPMMNSGDFDFSFSGLKTALLYATQKDSKYSKRINEYCFEFEEAITEVLAAKTILAAKKYKAQTVMMAGGVAANVRLRNRLAEAVDVEMNGHSSHKTIFMMPEIKYCTDNAAMIAAAACLTDKGKKKTDWRKMIVD